MNHEDRSVKHEHVTELRASLMKAIQKFESETGFRIANSIAIVRNNFASTYASRAEMAVIDFKIQP